MKSRWWTLICSLVLLLALPVNAQGVQPRIVGGAAIDITSAPWQTLLILNGNRQCAGAIVADQWILTAAHCVDGVNPAQVAVFTGVTQVNVGATRIPVANVFIHPQWNRSTFLNDIALIQLVIPLSFTPTQSVAALPDGLDPNTWPPAGTPATVAGWGATTNGGTASGALQQAQVQVLAGPGDGICGEYGAQFNALAQLCAGSPTGGVDACQGDSGGALVVDVGGIPTIAGLVSTGIECALPAFPGQYTRVTTYLDWLRQYVPLPASVPDPPSQVTAEARPRGAVLLNWLEPVGDGGTPITMFRVTSQPASQGCETSARTCLITGLAPGRRYTFAVISVNAVGESAGSPEASVVAVNRIARVGRSLKVADAGERIRVRQASRSICRASGPRVRLIRPGICRVTSSGVPTVIQVLARPVSES